MTNEFYIPLSELRREWKWAINCIKDNIWGIGSPRNYLKNYVTNKKLRYTEAKLREVRGKYAHVEITPNTWQQRIYEATVARGYADGWTPEQFAARQVIKAVEELAELVELVAISGDPVVASEIKHFQRVVKDAGSRARILFDHGDKFWGRVLIHPDANTEAADVAITLANFAAAREFDLLEAAESKVTADIERGKRQ